MDIKKIWESEKPLIEKCITSIKYDEILTDTLDRLRYEVDKALIDGFDCSPSISQIIDTLENKRYNEDILSKASLEEKELVRSLLDSLYLLDTTIKYSKKPTKEYYFTDSMYKFIESPKIPNQKNSVDKYINLWTKDDTKKNLNEVKKLNKINNDKRAYIMPFCRCLFY